jgi:hypothetical protein
MSPRHTSGPVSTGNEGFTGVAGAAGAAAGAGAGFAAGLAFLSAACATAHTATSSKPRANKCDFEADFTGMHGLANEARR